MSFLVSPKEECKGNELCLVKIRLLVSSTNFIYVFTYLFTTMPPTLGLKQSSCISLQTKKMKAYPHIKVLLAK
jgi:hypothetical protein